jgi:hypothetical protein
MPAPKIELTPTGSIKAVCAPEFIESLTNDQWAWSDASNEFTGRLTNDDISVVWNRLREDDETNMSVEYNKVRYRFYRDSDQWAVFEAAKHNVAENAS